MSNEDFDWNSDLVSDEPEAPVRETTEAEPEDATADLLEAHERMTAKANADADAEAFRLKVERAKRGPVDPDLPETPDTPLTRTLADIPFGDPRFEFLKAELAYIAQERADKAKAAAESAVGPVSTDAEPVLAWDARDLTSDQFKALTRAATGGSREAPAGITPREWRLYLKTAGIG